MNIFEISIFNFNLAIDKLFESLETDFGLDIYQLECPDFEFNVKEKDGEFEVYVNDGCWSKEILNRTDKEKIQKYMEVYFDNEWEKEIKKILMLLKKQNCEILDIYSNNLIVTVKLKCNKNKTEIIDKLKEITDNLDY
jgi:adenylate kinase family enzyme